METQVTREMDNWRDHVLFEWFMTKNLDRDIGTFREFCRSVGRPYPEPQWLPGNWVADLAKEKNTMRFTEEERKEYASEFRTWLSQMPNPRGLFASEADKVYRLRMKFDEVLSKFEAKLRK